MTTDFQKKLPYYFRAVATFLVSAIEHAHVEVLKWLDVGVQLLLVSYCSVPSTGARSAHPVFTNGLRRSVSLAADGRRIRIGTPSLGMNNGSDAAGMQLSGSLPTRGQQTLLALPPTAKAQGYESYSWLLPTEVSFGQTMMNKEELALEQQKMKERWKNRPDKGRASQSRPAVPARVGVPPMWKPVSAKRISR